MKTKHPINILNIFLMLGALCIVVVILLRQQGKSQEEQPFSKVSWNNQRLFEFKNESDSPRWRMIDDLLLHKVELGEQHKDVLKLLGTPDVQVELSRLPSDHNSNGLISIGDCSNATYAIGYSVAVAPVDSSNPNSSSPIITVVGFAFNKRNVLCWKGIILYI